MHLILLFSSLRIMITTRLYFLIKFCYHMSLLFREIYSKERFFLERSCFWPKPWYRLRSQITYDVETTRTGFDLIESSSFDGKNFSWSRLQIILSLCNSWWARSQACSSWYRHIELITCDIHAFVCCKVSCRQFTCKCLFFGTTWFAQWSLRGREACH